MAVGRGALVGSRPWPRQTEVQDSNATIGPDDRVVGLEVPVHQSCRVRSSEAAAGLEVLVADLGPAVRLGPLPGSKIGAVDELEGHVDATEVGAHLVHLDDIGV